MITTALLLSLIFLPPSPTEITVVQFPARGKVSLSLGTKSKADVERTGTVTRVTAQLDGLALPHTVLAGMNSYVVWAVSPEGLFDNMGEVEVSGAKGDLEATTLFDRFAILVTAEPHYLVDKPGAKVVFKNAAPRDFVSVPASVEVGAYEYPELQNNAAGMPSLVMQARAAMAIATAVQAPQRAAGEFRTARVALETMEEFFRRGSPPDVVASAAHAVIRSASIATTRARQSAR